MFGLNPQIIILAVAMAISSIGGWKITSWYYSSEISDMRADKAKAAAEAIRANRELEMLQISLAGAVAERDAYRSRKIDTQFRVITKKVVEYVQSPEPKCDVSSEWVRIHDASTSGGMSEDSTPSETSNGGTGTVKDDIILAIVTENYERCERNRNKLISLQEWVNTLFPVKEE